MELNHSNGSYHQPPDASQRLWQAIEALSFSGHHFARHVLVSPFIVDMACKESKVIVELDEVTGKEHEAIRTRYLREQGYVVLKFIRQDVTDDLNRVLSQLQAQLN
jgi:very-short-patch-repair endonuclease